MPLKLTLEKFDNVAGYDGKVFYVLHQYPGTGCPQYPYGALYEDASSGESNQIKFRRLNPTPIERFGQENKYLWPRDPRLQCSPLDVIEDTVVDASPPDGTRQEKCVSCHVPNHLMPVVQSVSSVSVETCQKLIGSNETSGNPSTSTSHSQPSTSQPIPSIPKTAFCSQINVPPQPCDRTANNSINVLDKVNVPKMCKAANRDSGQLDKETQKNKCSASSSTIPTLPSIVAPEEKLIPTETPLRSIGADISSVSKSCESAQAETSDNVPISKHQISSRSDSSKNSCVTSTNLLSHTDSIRNRKEQLSNLLLSNKDELESDLSLSPAEKSPVKIVCSSDSTCLVKAIGLFRKEEENKTETGDKVISYEPSCKKSLSENVKTLVNQGNLLASETKRERSGDVPKRRSSTNESSTSSSIAGNRAASALKDIDDLKAILSDDSLLCNYHDLKISGSTSRKEASIDSGKEKRKAPEIHPSDKSRRKVDNKTVRRRSGENSLKNRDSKSSAAAHGQSQAAADKEFDEYVDFLLETAMESKSSSSRSSEAKVHSVKKPEGASHKKTENTNENQTKERHQRRKKLEIEDEVSKLVNDPKPCKIGKRSHSISNSSIGAFKHKLPQIVTQTPSSLKGVRLDKDIAYHLPALPGTVGSLMTELQAKRTQFSDELENSEKKSKSAHVTSEVTDYIPFSSHIAHNKKLSSTSRRSSTGSYSSRKQDRSPEKYCNAKRGWSQKSFSITNSRSDKGLSNLQIPFIDLTLDHSEPAELSDHSKDIGDSITCFENTHTHLNNDCALQFKSTTGSGIPVPPSNVKQNVNARSPIKTNQSSVRKERNSPNESDVSHISAEDANPAIMSVTANKNCDSGTNLNNSQTKIFTNSSLGNSQLPTSHHSSVSHDLSKMGDKTPDKNSKVTQTGFTDLKSKHLAPINKSSNLEITFINLTEDQSQSTHPTSSTNEEKANPIVDESKLYQHCDSSRGIDINEPNPGSSIVQTQPNDTVLIARRSNNINIAKETNQPIIHVLKHSDDNSGSRESLFEVDAAVTNSSEIIRTSATSSLATKIILENTEMNAETSQPKTFKGAVPTEIVSKSVPKMSSQLNEASVRSVDAGALRKEIVEVMSEVEMPNVSTQSKVHAHAKIMTDGSLLIIEKRQDSTDVPRCSQPGRTEEVQDLEARRKKKFKNSGSNQLQPSLMSLFKNRTLRVNRLLLIHKYTTERVTKSSKLLRNKCRRIREERKSKQNNLGVLLETTEGANKVAITDTEMKDIPNTSAFSKPAASTDSSIVEGKLNYSPSTKCEGSKQAETPDALKIVVNMKKDHITSRHHKPMSSLSNISGAKGVRKVNAKNKNKSKPSRAGRLHLSLMSSFRSRKLRVNRLLLNRKRMAERFSTSSNLTSNKRQMKRNLSGIHKDLPRTSSEGPRQTALIDSMMLDTEMKDLPTTSGGSKPVQITDSSIENMKIKDISTTSEGSEQLEITNTSIVNRVVDYLSRTLFEESEYPVITDTSMFDTNVKDLSKTLFEGLKQSAIYDSSVVDATMKNVPTTLSEGSKQAEVTGASVVDANIKDLLTTISESPKQEAIIDSSIVNSKMKISPRTLLESSNQPAITDTSVVGTNLKDLPTTLLEGSKQEAIAITSEADTTMKDLLQAKWESLRQAPKTGNSVADAKTKYSPNSVSEQALTINTSINSSKMKDYPTTKVEASEQSIVHSMLSNTLFEGSKQPEMTDPRLVHSKTKNLPNASFESSKQPATIDLDGSKQAAIAGTSVVDSKQASIIEPVIVNSKMKNLPESKSDGPIPAGTTDATTVNVNVKGSCYYEPVPNWSYTPIENPALPFSPSLLQVMTHSTENVPTWKGYEMTNRSEQLSQWTNQAETNVVPTPVRSQRSKRRRRQRMKKKLARGSLLQNIEAAVGEIAPINLIQTSQQAVNEGNRQKSSWRGHAKGGHPPVRGASRNFAVQKLGNRSGLRIKEERIQEEATTSGRNEFIQKATTSGWNESIQKATMSGSAETIQKTTITRRNELVQKATTNESIETKKAPTIGDELTTLHRDQVHMITNQTATTDNKDQQNPGSSTNITTLPNQHQLLRGLRRLNHKNRKRRTKGGNNYGNVGESGTGGRGAHHGSSFQRGRNAGPSRGESTRHTSSNSGEPSMIRHLRSAVHRSRSGFIRRE